MEPIISPWVFYWVGVLDSLHVLGIVASIGLCTCGILLLAMGDDFTEKRNKERLKQLACVFSIFVTIVFVFVPTKETMYQMIVAHYATPNNMEYMKDNTVKFIQDVAKAIGDENESRKEK